MDSFHLKQLLEVCFTAKKVIETLPELPEGMKPRHIHVLEAVSDIVREEGICRVSDVSMRMKITKPSISRLIRELEEKEMLTKNTDETDRRVIYVGLTEQGRKCLGRYVTDFHREWAMNLKDITNAQAEMTVEVIEKLLLSMPGGKRYHDEQQ